MSFQNPDLVQYSPSPLWFWNDKLDPEELRRQVRLMHRGGVKNFIMHARWGLQTPYLTREWWRMVGAAVDEARRQGGRAWVYDEYSYPSGICGFKITAHEQYRERYLVPVTGSVHGGWPYEEELPQGQVVASFAYPESDGMLDESRPIPIKIGAGAKRICWQPPDGKSYRIYTFIKQIEPKQGVGLYSVNYLSPEPTKKFIQWTHEEYAKRYQKDFGGLIPYFFLDEPRFGNALPWDESIPAIFRKRQGYDLLPKLALLLARGKKETSRVRCDFWSFIGDLYCESFFQPVGEWCARHGVELMGHLMAEETLSGNTRYSGHGMKPYRHFQMPGIDHLGKGIGGLSPKLASSSAHHYGNRRVSSETFAGCGWDFTVGEMTAITHWLYSQGVNTMVPHAFFYSTRGERKNDWPPSMFFQWKHWRRYPEYAARVARLSETLSGGRHVADIALYYPMESFHAHYVPDARFKTGFFRKGPQISDPTALAIEETYQRVGHALQTHHRDFDLMDTETMLSLRVAPGRLEDSGSGESFRVLVLPYVTILDLRLAGLIENFVAKGGAVLALGVLPRDSTRRENDPAVQAAIRRIFARKGRAIFIPWEQCGPAEVRKALAALDRLLGTPDIRLSGSRQAGDWLEWSDKIHDPYTHENLTRILKSGKGGVCAYHYKKDGEDLYFLANLMPRKVSFKATLAVEARFGELRFPGTGRCATAEISKRSDGTTTVALVLPALESVLIALS